MALPKEDRISFSKQIVGADSTKTSIEGSKKAITIEKNKAFNLDQANKRLVDAKALLVDGYQAEFARYDGIVRTTLSETDIQNSANLVIGNFLYPNNPQNPPPSTAPNVWTKTKPYARNKAIGKQYDETFAAPISAEQSKTTAILALITAIETNYTLIQRVTGQECGASGTCSIPIHTTQTACQLAGGIWTPGPDIISTNTALNTDYNDLLSAINDLKSHLLTTQPTILTSDTDTTRQTQNNTASSNINTIVAALDAWLALTPFNTSHGQINCAGFNSYNPALLGATRLQSGELDTLEAALISRQTFVTSRVGQLNSNLGSITQDLTTGNVTGSGLYFERWNFIQLRLNLFGGSLVAFKGFEKAIEAQNAQQAQIDLAKNSYTSLLTTSALSAPTNGTKVVHVKSSAGFLVGDNVYIVSDTQDEILRTIESIDGNRIVVGVEVPPKYRPAEAARLYKDIS